MTVVSADDVNVAAAAVADAETNVTAADEASGTQADEASAESPVAEPVAPKARRGRRVARKAAAPTGSAPDAGMVIVVPATEDTADTAPDQPGTASDEAAAPITAAAEQPVEPVEVPAARPRRRRAAARPAGPPVDIDV